MTYRTIPYQRRRRTTSKEHARVSSTKIPAVAKKHSTAPAKTPSPRERPIVLRARSKGTRSPTRPVADDNPIASAVPRPTTREVSRRIVTASNVSVTATSGSPDSRVSPRASVPMKARAEARNQARLAKLARILQRSPAPEVNPEPAPASRTPGLATDVAPTNRYRMGALVHEQGPIRVFDVPCLRTRRLLTRTTYTLGDGGDWDGWERFIHHCTVLRSLKHDMIPGYIEHSDDGLCATLLTDRVVGRSLEQRVLDGDRYSEPKLRHVLVSGLKVLDYLHSLHPPVFHCGVHPDAFILSDKGHLTLTGYGRAASRLVCAEAGPFYTGRDGYAAPAQWNERPSPATDLYGFGATMLAIACGHDAALLPTRNGELDVAQCLGQSALRTAIEGLVSSAAETRLAMASRIVSSSFSRAR